MLEAAALTYILIGQTPVFEPDAEKWARWMETADRVVGRTAVGAVVVSTVFLGLDHRYGHGPPELFETMIFGAGGAEDFQERCATWLEAERQHAEAVRERQKIEEQASRKGGENR